MANGPGGAANMYRLLQQQQQVPKAGGDAGLAFPADLDVQLALAQQLQGLQAQQQRPQVPANGALNSMNQATLLALMQANPALAQQLAQNQANVRPDPNPLAAAAAAAATAAQQARAQQASAALAANLLRSGVNGTPVPGVQAGASRLPGQAAAGNNVQGSAQLAALQRAVQVQQLLQQQQQQQQQQQNANQQAQLMQAAAALAAQQQQQQNVQKQAQQLQAQQMLKAVLERNNQGTAQQQQAMGGMGQNAPVNAAALVKQLQLHDALAKQDALARQAQQAQNITPGLAELLLRQQAAQQQQDANNRNAANNAAAANNLAKVAAALTPAQLQQLASTPAGQAFLRSVLNGQGQPGAASQQAAGAASAARGNNGAGLLNMMNGAAPSAAGAPQGAINALLAAQSMMANNRGAANGGVNGAAGPGGAEGGVGNGLSGNKEQRRLALACVALQLARSGISIDQAINSGMMGGMSVIDVRFIVECYNAECERMKAAGSSGSVAGAGSVNGAPNGLGTRANTQSVQSSRTQSPATSIAGSHMSMFGLSASQVAAAVGGAGGSIGPSGTAGAAAAAARFASMDVPRDAALAAAAVNGAPRSASDDAGSPRSRTSNQGKLENLMSVPSGGAGGNAGMAAGTAAALHAASTHFNAFNYGFFGSTGGMSGQDSGLQPSGGYTCPCCKHCRMACISGSTYQRFTVRPLLA